MTHRIHRIAMVLALVAGATTTATLFEALPAHADTALTFGIVDQGLTGGTVFVDAFWGDCGGTSPDGSGYDAAFNWSTSNGFGPVSLAPRSPYTTSPTNVPTNGGGCGSKSLSLARVEIYPNLNHYDARNGSVGGAHAQRSLGADGSAWKTFGNMPLPTIGQLDAFRITGKIVSSTPVPNYRLKLDVFEVGCSYPESCQPLKSTNAAPNVVGAFSTSKSVGAQWTGSVGWPGRYLVFVNDCSVGWPQLGGAGANDCAGGVIRRATGFMQIENGNVPAIDLDAACFGMLNCQYSVGAVAPSTVGEFHPLPPTRLLDTRVGGSDLEPGPHPNGALSRGDGSLADPNPINRTNELKNHELKVTGLGGIPTFGVAAVLLNVTAATPPGKGWLTVYPRPPVPAGQSIYDNQATFIGTRPPTSNLNVEYFETVPNLVLARVGTDGKIRFWNANPGGKMDVIVDVAGWYDTTALAPNAPANGLGFTAITPHRLLSTRDGIGAPIARMQPGDQIQLKVRDLTTVDDGVEVPVDAESVVINITSGAPTGKGFVTAYPTGSPVPNASNLNVNPNILRANLAVVKVGDLNSINLAVFGTDMNLFADIVGYFSEAGGDTTIINPTRMVDSRSGLRTPAGQFDPDSTRNLQVAGPGTGIPLGVTAVILNVTAGGSDSYGFLTIWPAGLPKPDTSNINWPNAGRDTPNMVMVAVDANGYISVYNSTLGHIHVIVDVLGYVS